MSRTAEGAAVNTGQVISGAAHLGLIGWAFLGNLFVSEPTSFEVTEVTAISAEDYAALTAPEASPDAVANVDTPDPPDAGEAAPDLASESDTAPELNAPETAEATPPDEAPDMSGVSPPVETELSDEVPPMQTPEEDTAVLMPEASPRPEPRPAPRVAPEPVAPPEPDVEIDDVDQQETAPDAEAETEREETEETAREEAASEIVTEAEEPDSAAPSRSMRPRARPARTEPREEEPEDPPETTTEPEIATEPETDDRAVEDALAEALGGTGESSAAPSGPPLTSGEKDALRVAVQNCWNVGSLSSDASRTTVVVGVSMAKDGRPQTGTIRMISASGGSEAAARQAFEAARRAIIRCGSDGYDLPRESYDRWRDIEMTFNPETMRIK